MRKEIETWAVEVHLNGERALSIGHGWLSGRDDIDDFKPEIRRCAENLLAFIGEDLPDVTDLRTRLAAAEQEVERMFHLNVSTQKHADNLLAKLHEAEKERDEAKAGWEAADIQISIEAGDVMRLTTERDELRAENERLAKIVDAQAANLKERDGRISSYSNALEREIELRTAAQQSAKEQFGAGCMKGHDLIDATLVGLEDLLDGKFIMRVSDFKFTLNKIKAAIREAAKERGE
ncbi:hypothetical protein KP003_16765 [Geomonas nitrogeniifigens]|uniref:hypothetical protein n=1 Tax=Geomonas diazotrophica TaxID=2843197 RepID=UPI001C2BEFC5|nr:hypothetical protein [Geomonas nitrogeniifigens]QXE85994.1 hypothetical protein KP003_16765 [Geomonas nitrogeniifigens]